MLKEEFEKLIGRTASMEEYTQANFVYMMCGDRIDKETLCKEWPTLKESVVVIDLAQQVEDIAKKLSTTTNNLTYMLKMLVNKRPVL